jgi:hypothetical protein
MPRIRIAMVTGALLAACASFGASAAGMVTHALVADLARQALPEGALKTILTRHRPTLLAGAIHPDGGYGSGAIWEEDREMAERAHWEDFNDAYIQHLQEIGCTGELGPVAVPRQPLGLVDLNGLSDRCGKLIAFMYGNAAHGLTDETWDSLFEPVVHERDLADGTAAAVARSTHAGPHCRSVFATAVDEAALRSALEREDLPAIAKALALGGTPGIEYAMDMVAIMEQNLVLDVPLLVMPPVEDLVTVHAINRPELGITAAQVRRGFLVSKAAVLGERLIALEEAARMQVLMPWASANYYMNSGGVIDSAQMTARLYEHLWDKLLGTPRAIEVVGVHPQNGERGVPTDAAAAEASIRAFTGQSATEASVEQPGVICLFDEDGARVEGETRSGIYDPEWGHVIAFAPAADLKPNHRYTVVVTDRIVDHFGSVPDSAHSWTFRTSAQ